MRKAFQTCSLVLVCAGAACHMVSELWSSWASNQCWLRVDDPARVWSSPSAVSMWGLRQRLAEVGLFWSTCCKGTGGGSDRPAWLVISCFDIVYCYQIAVGLLIVRTLGRAFRVFQVSSNCQLIRYISKGSTSDFSMTSAETKVRRKFSNLG